ncbi:MAG: hypothetical protein V5A40_18170 [Haloarculaceae archaeon]
MRGGDPTSTFSLLGNETRLRIVLELGDASEPGTFGVLGFSELQSRVGVRDNGTFNYHLSRLTGEFVERAEGGYRLALPGVYVYRALRTGPLAETPDHGRLETDVPCPTCAVPQEVWVEEGRGTLGCPDCGTVNYRYPLPAGGQARTAGPALARALRERAIHDAGAMLRGFCPYCSGSIHRDVGVDVEVLPDGDRVEGVDDLTLTLACEHCGWFIHTNAAGMLDSHPRVSAFLLERGVDSYRQDPWRVADFSVDVRSKEPWIAHVRVTCEDGTLSLELDGDLQVVDLETGRTRGGNDGPFGGGDDDRSDVTGSGSGV